MQDASEGEGRVASPLLLHLQELCTTLRADGLVSRDAAPNISQRRLDTCGVHGSWSQEAEDVAKTGHP